MEHPLIKVITEKTPIDCPVVACAVLLAVDWMARGLRGSSFTQDEIEEAVESTLFQFGRMVGLEKRADSITRSLGARGYTFALKRRHLQSNLPLDARKMLQAAGIIERGPGSRRRPARYRLCVTPGSALEEALQSARALADQSQAAVHQARREKAALAAHGAEQ